MRLIGTCLSSALFSTLLVTQGCRNAAPGHAAPIKENVVLVCEHGNVKSLIAASLFNQLASARGLPFRAESRGLNPESGVPASIVEALRAEGIDVAIFNPRALSDQDAASASRVVAIGVDLTSFAADTRAPIDLWSDIPPASVDYSLSRAALIRHIEALLQELQRKR